MSNGVAKVEDSQAIDNQQLGPEHKDDLFAITDCSSAALIQNGQPFTFEQTGPLRIDTHPAQPFIELPPIPGPSRSRKRKRKMPAQPEETCWKCRRPTPNKNEGLQENLLSCYNCGRSEHPSCTGKDVTWLRSWDWVCDQCKRCEICEQVSVNDGELLSCGRCDRGWHLSCLEATGSPEPLDLPTCPECRPSSLDNSKAPSFTPTSLDETVAPDPNIAPERRIGSPRPFQPKTIPSTKPRKQRQRSSISSMLSNKALQSPIEPHPPKRRSKSRTAPPPPKVDQPSELPLVIAMPRPKAAPNQAQPRARISIRLPPKRKSEAAMLESPKRKAFEEILTCEEADTSKTNILEEDRARFEKSRNTAEAKLGVPLVPPPGTPMGMMTPNNGPQTPKALLPSTLSAAVAADASPPPSRPLKTPLTQAHLLPSTPGPSVPKSFANAVAAASGPPPLRIRTIRIGEYEVDTWYDAPFPEEYAAVPEGKLYMCEFCLKYSKSPFGAARHRMKCTLLHPPGDEIYRDGSISIFEVDGRHNKIYCQNLCLLSKMFLDHKSLFYDVEPFLFYVMTEVDNTGAHFVGYFSKEKRSPKDFNVSCIMTLPVRQKSGWGNLLIDFSYLLTFNEGRYGTPERPLSKLGAIAYGRYWQLQVYKVLYDTPPGTDLRMEDICRKTRMTLEDVFNTLRIHGLIVLDSATPSISNHKVSMSSARSLARRSLANKSGSTSMPYHCYQSGTNLSIYDLTSVPTHYTITWSRRAIKQYLDKYESKGLAKLRPEKLRWSPYLVARAHRADPRLAGGALWDVEVDDTPEPTMHSYTPLEPVERPLLQKSNSESKTRKRMTGLNGTSAGTRWSATHDRSPTVSTFDGGLEDLQEDDDDEFRDDGSIDVPTHGSQHRTSNPSRIRPRRPQIDDDDESDPEWDNHPTNVRRTRSGRILDPHEAQSGSEWEDGPRLRTRSRSHNTKSSRRAASSSLSINASLVEVQNTEDGVKHVIPRKRAPRVITSPSDSGHEDAEGEDEIHLDHGVVKAEDVEHSAGQDRSFDSSVQVPTDLQGPATGLTSDDQLPETPRVVVTEEHVQTGLPENTITPAPDDQASGWPPESSRSGFQIQIPITVIQEPSGEPLTNGVEFKVLPKSASPMLTPQKVDQEPRAASEDAVMKEVTYGWQMEEDDMDMCDEDAEGEDDLTIMA